MKVAWLKYFLSLGLLAIARVACMGFMLPELDTSFVEDNCFPDSKVFVPFVQLLYERCLDLANVVEPHFNCLHRQMLSTISS